MFEKLEEIQAKYDELGSQLGDPTIAANPREYQKIAKEHGRLHRLVEAFTRFQEVEVEIEENEQIAHEEDDEMRAMAREEIVRLKEEHVELTRTIRELLIPPDPLDEKNIFIEVRAGTGGDEAALFAADLFRMYCRYAERKGWRVEITSVNETDHGGYKEIVAEIIGTAVYSHLKYEKGTHRVQRVPATESQGRIHTSAVTVAVMPEVDDVEIDVRTEDLRIDTFRASGAGGQHVNKTESAIRITHIPTGVVVSCQDEKSQHKNKARAMKLLKSRLFDAQLEAQQSAIAAERREQVGSGDRSERIRTYNFPQNRVSDHRISLTLYNLDQVIEGGLDDVVEPLQGHYRTEALKAIGAD